MNRVQLKNDAIKLRRDGHTYSEIQAILGVSKGTLSGWFKYITLSPSEEQIITSRIDKKQIDGRNSAILRNRAKRFARESEAEIKAKLLFDKYVNIHGFQVGLALYWAEGSKRTHCIQFINSDYNMIVFMIKWLCDYLDCKKDLLKFRLFIHAPYKNEDCESFWSNKIGVEKSLFQKTIYKPTPHSVKKNPDYKGCLRIELQGIENLRIVKAWQKMIIEYYGKDLRL